MRNPTLFELIKLETLHVSHIRVPIFVFECKQKVALNCACDNVLVSNNHRNVLLVIFE